MNTSPEVDSWFEASDSPVKAEMLRVREIVLGADERVEETIKWKQPTFMYKGNIASFNPAKKLVSLMFHQGAKIPGDHPKLEGDGNTSRVMRFADMDAVEAQKGDLEAAVRAWIEMKG